VDSTRESEEKSGAYPVPDELFVAGYAAPGRLLISESRHLNSGRTFILRRKNNA